MLPPPMLTQLAIRNYALIEELSAEFPDGLVILTGETGAGKSIIIDALGLVLGERASPEAVRAGADRAVAEGTFRVGDRKEIRDLLAEGGMEPGEEMLLRREVSARGQSRCFMNDTPVPLALLRRAGDLLVDLHGQHEHQSLLRTEHHLGLLDAFGGLGREAEAYRATYERLRADSARLRALREREAAARERSELLAFQHREITNVAPERGEEEALGAELRVLENSEKLFAEAGRVLELLAGEERAVHDALVRARNALADLAAIDPRLEEPARECTSAEVIVGELARALRQYHGSLEFRPDRLEEVRERLGHLGMLKRKYGGSLEAVIAHRDRIAVDLALAENAGGEIRDLGASVEASWAECVRRAERLSAGRKAAAKKLDRAVCAELRRLGIAHPRFVTVVAAAATAGPVDPPVTDGPRLNASGGDEVEFLLSTNLGEEPRSLVRVASGGEVSRIMLALKTILAGSDRLPVLVFDEIDTGVSGRIARITGLSLKNLARHHQVIAITHLPQIAGLADAHFAVEKTVLNGRTATKLRRLDGEERVVEVARLLSGAEITAAGLRGARELMNTDEDH